MKILIINGPNINLLGLREPKIYGERSYGELLSYLKDITNSMGVKADMFQSNSEGSIVDRIQAAYGNYEGMIINAAGYSHTSVALHDAIKAVGIPCVGVHLSDPALRESFRHTDIVGEACISVVKGLGFASYEKALIYLLDNIKASNEPKEAIRP